MLNECYTFLYYSINNILYAIIILGYRFTNHNITKIMIDNRVTPYMKHQITLMILNIHNDIIKDYIIYNDIVSRYHYRNKNNTNLLMKIKKIINFQNIILKCFYDILDTVKSFNIKHHPTDKCYDEPEINLYPDSKDEEQLGIFKDVLKNLDNFKIYQFELFNKKRSSAIEKYDDFEYENIFSQLLDRFLKRIDYIETLIIEIKYHNRINIKCSLYEAMENINNYISDCNKEDIEHPIFKNI